MNFKNYILLGPVHTNPFTNENGAVLLRFQKDLRPHLSFSYRFRPSTLQRRSREKPHDSVCPPFWILTVEWSGARSCLFLMTSPFSESIAIVFSVHTRKQRFKKTSFSNRFRIYGSVFGDRFQRCRVTIAVSGAKQLRFRLKTYQCGRGLN